MMHTRGPRLQPWLHRSARARIAIVGSCGCVAAGTLMTKHLVDALPVLPVVFLQVLASTALTWSIAIARRSSPSPRQLLTLGFPGVLQPGLAYILGFTALAITPSSVLGLLWASESAVVVLLAWPLIGERPKGRTLLAVGAGVAGIVIVGGAVPSSSAPPLLGVLLALGGVCSAALDTVISRRLALTADTITMTAAGQLSGLATVAASAPLWPWHDLAPLAASGTLATIFASGVLIHGVATLLFNYGLGGMSAGTAAMLFPLIAILTAAGGVIWLGDTLSAAQLLGAALIIGSAIAAGRDS